MKLDFSRQIFEKYLKFNENSFSGAELFHADGRTERRKERYDEATSRFSQFCERA